MPQYDPRIDAYIARSAEFAQPILVRLRGLVHAACPEAEETLKWSAPAFLYKGRILCGMAAFKQHAAFNIWHGALVVGKQGSDAGMGQFGRLTRVADLPGKREMTGYLKQAMQLIDDGVKAPSTRIAATKPPATVPDDLAAALKKNRRAQSTFDGFPPGQQREYIEWLTEAKREETRARRLQQAVEWMAEGKRRHWKYQAC